MGILKLIKEQGPLHLEQGTQGPLHLEQGTEVGHSQGNMKHSRLGTAVGGKGPKQSQELWGDISHGPGDTRAASPGEGDWENALQPFVQLEMFPWSWNKERFHPERAKSMEIPA